MISINNLSKRLGTFALGPVSLDIPDGEYVVMVGDSGSGKSLLLELIAGLVTPDQGALFLDGRDLSINPLKRSPFGMVFQDLALFPHLTVRQNIAYPLKIRRLAKIEIFEEIKRLVTELEIAHLLDRYPSTLSGGEKQRVALARTLATKPACLLLDEPLSSVDAHIRRDIKSLLRKINRSGQTIIHVTHDYQEAVNLATRIGILENGKLIRYGQAREVLSNPVNPFMASFVGIRNFIPVTVKMDPGDNHVKAWSDHGIQLVVNLEGDDGKGYLIVPEEAIFLSVDPVITSAANQLHGIVADIVPVPLGLEVSVDVGFMLHALLTADGVERLSVRPGDAVYASFKASALRFISAP